MSKDLNTKVVTGKVRLSYLHAFEPQKAPGSDVAKYSVSIIIPKSDKATMAKITQAYNNAVEIGIAEKWGGKKPANLKKPVRDGDKERPDDAAYANSWFINANSKDAPGLVDRQLNRIIDQSELYSGCYGRVSINFFPYNNVSVGVAAGLNHIQKLEDGEPLGGRASVESDFGDDFGDDEYDEDEPDW